ncbi:conserved hypothetical protein [Paraburkholderia ribeironis]|uniref:Uncharacterized protein n=1 Tax=Paraburkholderia ribeironis TaxID=1247936 RepID=A0A1N7RID1_9BURK|nr:hypothetical protein [Paraburkholderia ribeironis]SIT34852.1 conserved hypothetical protein [Paraburkholderia ribeironis]
MTKKEQHPDSPVMKQIKTASQRAGALLDADVGLANLNVPVTSALRQPGGRTMFLDVPVRAVVALGHRNFARTATTWRSLLAGLHGKTWDERVIGYFESEIGLQEFPPPDANRPLELEAVGGMVEAVNGMHRLTAAICWLAAKHGEDAVLRKVQVHVSEAWPELTRRVVDETARGHVVQIGLDYRRGTRWLRVERNGLVEVFGLEANAMKAFPDTRGGIERGLDRVRGLKWGDRGIWKKVEWRTVTPHMAAALGDDDWLKTQLALPAYEAIPA